MSFYCRGRYVSDDTFGEKKNVIKAIDKFNGDAVAIKRWSSEDHGSDREIEVWKTSFKKDFLASWEDGGITYCARKWFEGQNLAEYIFSEGCLEEEQAVKLILKICKVLNEFYFQEQKVFCDLKPENIIINNDNVKLIDFETAQKENIETGDLSTISSSNTIYFASKEYSAPEMYHGEISYAADVYSLGIILHFVLFGSLKKTSTAFKNDELRSLYEVCTAHSREARFANISDVMKTCERVLASFKKAEDIIKNKTKVQMPVIQVENMNVQAGQINYDSAEGYDTNPGEKVLLFPKKRMGYRRMVIYIPDNAAFAAELAFVLAKVYELQTALFDVSSYFNESFLYYLPLNLTNRDKEVLKVDFMKEDKQNYFLVADGDEDIDKLFYRAQPDWFKDHRDIWIEKGLMYNCCESEQLFVSVCNVLNELEMESEDIRDFAVWCYSNFDITILYDRESTNSRRRAELMRYSDYVAVSAETDVDEVMSKKRFFEKFMEDFSVPISKLKFVGWDYNKNESVEHESIVTSLGEFRYLGTVEKDIRRRSDKNLKGSFYCQKALPKLKTQYSVIIEKLIFQEKKTA